MSDQVYIVSGCRTAIGTLLGQFQKFSASELGTFVIKESLKRAEIIPEDVDQVIMGQVLTAGQGQNPARQSSIGAHIPCTKPAFTINMLCGSGLKSVFLGYQAIRNKDAAIVVAGGQENMTKAHHSTYVRGAKLGNIEFIDTLVNDGLTDAFNKVHMGGTAEYLAKTYNVSRLAQDEFATLSQTKTGRAIDNGYFDDEIVPIIDKRTNQGIKLDEFPRPKTTVKDLEKLRPAFDKNGTVTPGNASGINDGAAAVVLCSEEQVKLKNLKPLARIIGFAEAGVDPMEMGLGPVTAVNKLLLKIGWSKDDVDLYELNEAFAVQSILVIEQLQLDKSKVNVNGGAIALGHPIGASGARILVTLLYNLRRLNKKHGIAALCIGGGMGIAVAVELC